MNYRTLIAHGSDVPRSSTKIVHPSSDSRLRMAEAEEERVEVEAELKWQWAMLPGSYAEKTPKVRVVAAALTLEKSARSRCRCQSPSSGRESGRGLCFAVDLASAPLVAVLPEVSNSALESSSAGSIPNGGTLTSQPFGGCAGLRAPPS